MRNLILKWLGAVDKSLLEEKLRLEAEKRDKILREKAYIEKTLPKLMQDIDQGKRQIKELEGAKNAFLKIEKAKKEKIKSTVIEKLNQLKLKNGNCGPERLKIIEIVLSL